MALVLPGNAVFLHIPKTGGSWVTRVLTAEGLVRGRIGHKHADVSHLRVRRGMRSPANWTADNLLRLFALTDTPRLFCVVRNPLAWYESWYRYQCWQGWAEWGRTGSLRHWHPNSDLNGIGGEGTGFNTFVSRVNARLPGYVSALFARYTDLGGARVLHQERLADELAALLAEWELGCNAEAVRDTARENVSPPAPLEWDPEVLRETVLNERPALLRYGYLEADGPGGGPVATDEMREILGLADGERGLRARSRRG